MTALPSPSPWYRVSGAGAQTVRQARVGDRTYTAWPLSVGGGWIIDQDGRQWSTVTGATFDVVRRTVELQQGER